LYHTKLNLYKKKIRISKQRALANFCGSIESTAEQGRFRTILVNTNADSWTENSQETLELLLDTHFPKNTQVVEDLYIEENLDDQSIDNISNSERVKWAINSFKPFKTHGPDGFFPAQLERTLDISLPRLTVIFHGSLALHHIPTRWLDVKVILIPKAGKPSNTNPKDFRPISLSSFLLKTLERLIDIHIRLTINPSLRSDAQHAYRKGRSTDIALHSLTFIIERGFRSKKYSLAAFLEIEGTFNNVTPTAITGALTELGTERPIVGLIHTMLTSRVVYSTMGSAHSTRNVSRGVYSHLFYGLYWSTNYYHF